MIPRRSPELAACLSGGPLGIPSNRIFYLLNHVMAPIAIRLTAAEIAAELTKSGASGVRRLERGAEFDRVEAIYRGDPHAAAKYGVGESRFVFTKDAAPATSRP